MWRSVLVIVSVGFLAVACAYPHRSTSLVPTRMGPQEVGPPNLWQIRFVRAEVPPRRRGDVSWDPEGGRPDPFLRFFVDGRRIYESPILEDTFEPVWNALLPANVAIPRGIVLRIELWDRDEINADPIGIWTNQGLPPQALPEADARVMLEGGATLEFRVELPRPHRGVGIREYEVRADALRILRVEALSPAGRAGIRPGDAIVAVAGETVASLGEARAATALSLAQDRNLGVTVQRADGTTRDVELDDGYVWLTL